MEKYIWLTGATSGLGNETAKILLRTNKMLLTGRNNEALNTLKAQHPENAILMPCDVSDYNLTAEKLKYVKNEGFISCLINNAGIIEFSDVENQKFETIQNIMSVNFLAAVNNIKLVLPEMIERKQGTIVNILSVVTEKIYKNSAAYTAAKIALKGFTQVLREEVRNKGIKIINIYPGAINTPIWHEKVRSKYSEQMMEAEEVARVITALLSDNKAVVEELVIRSIYGDL